MNTEDFISLLSGAQRHISVLYSEAVSDKDKTVQLKAYIEKYLRDKGFTEETELKNLVDRIYSEMAEYSVLTKYLGREDIEEVNINGWDDIAVTYRDGRTEKAKEHFFSPKHAEDIVKRLLHHSGMIIDNACPIAQGHLPGNTRITAVKTPVVDEDRGISASIRLLHNSDITTEKIVSVGTATEKMTDFLCMCLRYGVSFLVAGATSSGKTTLLNALLATVPDEKRIFTIESGSRELSLIKRKDGRVVNNVVHIEYTTPDTAYEAAAPAGFVKPAVPEERDGYATWWEYLYVNGAFEKKTYGIGIGDSADILYPSLGGTTISSGRGFSADIRGAVIGVSGYLLPNPAVHTEIQYMTALFPEFSYRQGAELCTTLIRNALGRFELPDSFGYGKLHFIPLSYPDGEYRIAMEKSDLWTPAGMVSARKNSEPLTVSGSVYDEYYIGR